MTTLWLTQIDGLALKVEVFQHQHKKAALRGGLHPTAHLAALDVIPGGEGWGRQNSTLYRLETHRNAHKVIRNKTSHWVTVQILSTTPVHYRSLVRDEEKNLREVFQFAQDHTVTKGQSRDSNSG